MNIYKNITTINEQQFNYSENKPQTVKLWRKMFFHKHV